jgi:hypothetical protein
MRDDRNLSDGVVYVIIIHGKPRSITAQTALGFQSGLIISTGMWPIPAFLKLLSSGDHFY